MPPLRRSRREIDYSQFCDVLDDFSGSDDDYERSPSPPPIKKGRSKPSKSKLASTPKQKSNASLSLPQKCHSHQICHNLSTRKQKRPVNSSKVTLSTVTIYEYQDRACLAPTDVISPTVNSSHQDSGGSTKQTSPPQPQE